MPLQRQYSSFIHAPVESDTAACHLHQKAVSEHCFLPSGQLPGQQAPFSLPNDSIYYDPSFEQLYSSDTPTAPGPSEFYVNHPTTGNVFGLEGWVQSTANSYDMSLEPSDPLDAGFISPAQPFPSMNLFQATGSNTSIGHPAPGQEYVGQNCSGVGSAGTTLCAPNPVNSASFPSEVSQAHTSPARLEDSATSVTPQETSRSSGDLKPCEWRNDQGGICGELLGRDCERHLALAHRIRGLPADMVVVCGACGEGKKRKFFVRHFREVHLRIPRQRRNVT